MMASKESIFFKTFFLFETHFSLILLLTQKPNQFSLLGLSVTTRQTPPDTELDYQSNDAKWN